MNRSQLGLGRTPQQTETGAPCPRPRSGPDAGAGSRALAAQTLPWGRDGLRRHADDLGRFGRRLGRRGQLGRTFGLPRRQVGAGRRRRRAAARDDRRLRRRRERQGRNWRRPDEFYLDRPRQECGWCRRPQMPQQAEQRQMQHPDANRYARPDEPDVSRRRSAAHLRPVEADTRTPNARTPLQIRMRLKPRRRRWPRRPWRCRPCRRSRSACPGLRSKEAAERSGHYRRPDGP